MLLAVVCKIKLQWNRSLSAIDVYSSKLSDFLFLDNLLKLVHYIIRFFKKFLDATYNTLVRRIKISLGNLLFKNYYISAVPGRLFSCICGKPYMCS